METKKEMNLINVKISSNMVRKRWNKSKSYADSLKSYYVDNNTAADT